MLTAFLPGGLRQVGRRPPPSPLPSIPGSCGRRNSSSPGAPGDRVCPERGTQALPAQEEGASGWFRQQVWEGWGPWTGSHLAQSCQEPGRCQKALSSPGGSPVCHLLALLCRAVRPRMNHPVPLSFCKRAGHTWQRINGDDRCLLLAQSRASTSWQVSRATCGGRRREPPLKCTRGAPQRLRWAVFMGEGVSQTLAAGRRDVRHQGGLGHLEEQ